MQECEDREEREECEERRKAPHSRGQLQLVLPQANYSSATAQSLALDPRQYTRLSGTPCSDSNRREDTQMVKSMSGRTTLHYLWAT